MTLVEYLIDKGILNQASAKKISDRLLSNEEEGLTLEKAILDEKINPADLLKAKEDYYGVPSKDLKSVDVPFDILKYIPEESALHYKFVPIGLAEGFLEVGMVEPDDIEARDALNFISSKEDVPFKIFLITEEDFHRVLDVYKGLSGQVTKALGELESESSVNVDEELSEALSKNDKDGKSEPTIVEDSPVEKIVATIVRYAVEGNASDVHIEQMRANVRVRFRVDGVLTTSLVLPAKVHTKVVARIKVLARLKLDEKRKPQDGRFSAKVDGRKVDFRVSTFPSYYGEKIVIRILDQEKGVKKIHELGLNPRYLNMVKESITRSFGMILISGPTGSGKTTTLYSILEELDSESNNILSLEDPVEYSIEGVSQSQIRPEIGYTFATGLRTTLRQDPDIIMVGEIRDPETARLAIQASLTGHLVFSTIHTNTAAGIIPRLIDMGIDPYLIPPTLILGIAQRLVRKLCPGSGLPVKVEGSIKTMLDEQFADLPEQYKDVIPKLDEMLKVEPTADCPNGTRGREAVFEMYQMDRDIEKIILTNPIESAVYDEARRKGMTTMKEDAIIKALEKKVPFEEINRL